jgi:hypothetical protein
MKSVAWILIPALALLTTTVSLADTVFVDNLDDGAFGTGSLDDPYRSLQFAIDHAVDGDVLPAGTARNTEPTWR